MAADIPLTARKSARERLRSPPSRTANTYRPDSIELSLDGKSMEPAERDDGPLSNVPHHIGLEVGEVPTSNLWRSTSSLS